MTDMKSNTSSNDVLEKIFEQFRHSPTDNEEEAFWKTLTTGVKTH
jgi:hypothetical protein